VDGLYCYVVMPYGLKNALPTFVRAMSKTFGDLIRDKVEVYVDDIVVKTKRRSTLVEYLTLVFDRLWATRTKLNPDKCVFGVSAGKLLGFLVSYRGIEENLEKIKAIEAMRPPARIKDVQKLTGSLAALNRFISRLTERALPFLKLLRKFSPFSWIEEAEQAFQELKQHLVSLPILVASEPRESLYLYIAEAAEAVRMVLVVERTAQEAPEHGFYWPTALQDAVEMVKSCKACQFHAKQIHTPAQALQMIPPSWPFAVWGMDILGPFPRAVGGYRFLFVAIDKFTKWLEATPVVNITQGAAVAFLKSIVCRFGVPSRIITDNGTQFTSRIFQEYCEDIGTQLCFASMAHPRSNGQVERANAEILRGLKTRTYDCLKKHGANWVSELPSVLWGNRTTPSRATLFLVYGVEVCLPPEIIMGSPRVQAFDESMQEQLRREDMDFIDDRRWRAAIRNARYNQALRHYHQRFMHSRELRV
jgi:transposase InsO family protein